MKIVSIDVGAKGAFTVYDTEKQCYRVVEELSFKKSMYDIYERFSRLIRAIGSDTVIIIGEAMGMKRTIKTHSKFYAVIELVS